MIMIRAIVRPEKVGIVLSELVDAGFPAVTKIDVVGRGKQRGVKVGDIQYDEIPKEMLLLVVNEDDKEDIIKIIMKFYINITSKDLIMNGQNGAKKTLKNLPTCQKESIFLK